MSKRRILLIVVVLVVLAGIAGGVALWVRQNTGPRLLARTELAIRAGKLGKALDLAVSYAAQNPDDWRGYYYQADVYARQGLYAKARQCLALARARKHDPVAVSLKLAETYSFPAGHAIRQRDTHENPDRVRDVVAKFAKACEVLNTLVTETDPNSLDGWEELARNLQRCSSARLILAQLLSRKADVAKDTGLADVEESLRKQAAEQRTTADGERRRAITALLDVLRRDGSRAEAANLLVSLCIQTGDKAALAETRALLEKLPNPPAVAMMRLDVEELRSTPTEDMAAAWKRLRETVRKIDVLCAADPNNPQIELQRAELSLLLGDPNSLATAEKITEAIIEEDPRHHDARLLRARVAMARGQHALAERELFRLKSDFPGSHAAHYWYGRAAEATGKTELAREAMRAVTRLEPIHEPEHSLAREYLARALMREFPMQAFRDASAFLRAAPNNTNAMMLFVEAARRSGQTALARQTLDEQRNASAKDPGRLVVIANAYHALGDAETAMDVARQAAAVKPESLTDRFGVAQALIILGREAEADRMLTAEVRRDPNDPRPHFVLARRFETSGRTLQAVEHYRRAMELDPHSPLYRRSLARALMNVGQYDEALAALEPILVADEAARRMKLQIDILRGQAGAEEGYGVGFDGRAQFGLYRARAHLRRGELQRCVDICTAEMDKHLDDTPCRLLLGEAYLRLGKINECLQALLPVLSKKPDALPYYRLVTRVMSRLSAPGKVAEKLNELPGVRKDMVRLAVAELQEGIGRLAEAEAAFAEVAADRAAAENVRYLAALGRARALARAGRTDQAVGIFRDLLAKKTRPVQTRQAMYQVLLAAGRPAEALKVLSELLAAAKATSNAVLARQVAQWASAQGELFEALAACDVVQKARPDDPQTYVLRARVLAAGGKTDTLDELYRKAVSLQPEEPSLHVGLADALDAQQKPLEALAALKGLEALGEAGKASAQFHAGMLYLRWGLAGPASAHFDALVDAPMNPRQRLALGAQLIRTGLKDKAADVLRDVPDFSPQYLRAQLLLAGIAPDAEQKVAILRKLVSARPYEAAAVEALIAALTGAGRPAEALDAFLEYARAGHARTLAAGRPARRAVAAAVRAGKLDEAEKIARAMRRARMGREWDWLTVALVAENDPAEASRLLGEPNDAAEPVEAMLALSLAARAKDAAAVRALAARALGEGGGAASRPARASLRPAYRLLCALLAGEEKAAAAALTELAAYDALRFHAGQTLRDDLQGRRAAPEEIERLLRAEIVLGLVQPDLARRWALDVLKARPTCRWAGTVLQRCAAGLPDAQVADRLGEILAVLKPADGYVAQVLRGELMLLRQQYAQAAELFGTLARDHPGQARLVLQQAIATERAGWSSSDDSERKVLLARALELYSRAWEASGRKDPRAANNRAYVLTQLFPADKARIEEAAGLIQAALRLGTMREFLDTAGWIAHLQGRRDEALRLLRQAVKNQPASAEVHYHVGWAEAAAGNNGLARQHMNAAVQVVERLEAAGLSVPPAERRAAEMARRALLEIAPPRATGGPS